MEVEGFAVRWREIDFEVAGVDDDADGSFDGERDAIDEGMGDANGLNGEDAKLELATRLNLDEFDFVDQFVFIELAFDVGKGELGSIDGNFELAEDPRQAADVVFVAVREHDAAHLVLVFDEIGDVGDDDVDAEEFGFRKHEAGVDDEDVILPANGHAVHAKFAQTAERDQL